MKEINKIQEEILKADDKNIEKLWKNSIEDSKLEAFLGKMTKDELVKVAKRYSVKGMTTLKKADAVEKLRNVIIERNTEVLNSVNEDILLFIESIINNDGIKEYHCEDLIYSNYLRNRGIAFTGTIENKMYVTLPEEVREAYVNKINKELVSNAKNNGDIIKAIAGMAYYYGVASFSLIKENLERVFATTINPEVVESFVLQGEELGYDYVVDKDFIYHIDVEDVDMIIELQEKSELEYFKGDKKELIKAGKPDYIEECKQGKNLQRVIGELFIIDKNILRNEMEAFVLALKNEMDLDEAIDIFLQAYQIESEDEKATFVFELQQWARDIRRWSLKGHTENELNKETKTIVNTVKIGRNEPCVCGSGKKYKKCCGR